MYELVIRGGLVIDGRGGPGRRADVAIARGRVAAIGVDVGPAARTIDAAGRVVTPGFIDVHTHYDAHVFWDADTPSLAHGVTTVIAGNCGFSLAPLSARRADVGFVAGMLARAEGLAPDLVRAHVPWSWRTTADYLDRLDGRLGINLGVLVGHSTLRRAAMGARATTAAATAAERARMRRMLRAGLESGALGLSSSWARTHTDGSGQPVPSRRATASELIELAAVVGEHAGTSLQMIVAGGSRPFTRTDVAMLTALSCAARRPLNWNSLHVDHASLALCAAKLAASDHARRRGGKVIALVMPVGGGVRLGFQTGFLYDSLGAPWPAAMRAPRAERIGWFRDPRARRALGRAAAAERRHRGLVAWADMVVYETFHPAHVGVRGRTIGDLARARGCEPWDALCDLVVADGLRTSFGPPPRGATRRDWAAKAAVIRDRRTVIGGSDAGAHVDMIADYAYPTRLFAEAVRAHRALSIEEAVHQLTERPARLYGLRDRGRLVEGGHADFVVLDAATVDVGELEQRHDLPGGAARLHACPRGVDYVGVNGVLAIDRCRPTGARCGALLRAGADTTTPSLE